MKDTRGCKYRAIFIPFSTSVKPSCMLRVPRVLAGLKGSHREENQIMSTFPGASMLCTSGGLILKWLKNDRMSQQRSGQVAASMSMEMYCREIGRLSPKISLIPFPSGSSPHPMSNTTRGLNPTVVTSVRSSCRASSRGSGTSPTSMSFAKSVPSAGMYSARYLKKCSPLMGCFNPSNTFRSLIVGRG